MESFIAIRCAECGHQFRHLAVFPREDRGFEDFECFCPKCLTKLIITDDHKYDKDGYIIG